jgi:hypothetical protein
MTLCGLLTLQPETYGKGHGPYYFTLQVDGNIVIYGKDQHVIWSPNVDGKGGVRLVLQVCTQDPAAFNPLELICKLFFFRTIAIWCSTMLPRSPYGTATPT